MLHFIAQTIEFHLGNRKPSLKTLKQIWIIWEQLKCPLVQISHSATHHRREIDHN